MPRHLENIVLKCTAIAAMINFFVSYLLIPVFKENGAAIGSLIAERVALVVALIIAFKVDTRVKTCIPSLTNILVGCALISFWCIGCRYYIVSLVSKTVVAITGSIIIYITFLIILRDPVSDEIYKLIYKIRSKK